MGLNLTIYRQRGCVRTITVTESDGSNTVFAAGDVFRLKIGRDGAAPLLDLDSKAATANGSGCTAANPTTLTLDRRDVTMPAGVYDIEALIVDDSDSDQPKQADKGVLTVVETQAGDTGLT
jgi:hypothetical protein